MKHAVVVHSVHVTHAGRMWGGDLKPREDFLCALIVDFKFALMKIRAAKRKTVSRRQKGNYFMASSDYVRVARS